MALSEKLQRDDSHRVLSGKPPPAAGLRPADVSVGSTALVGACAAFHVHLLEWLRITDEDDGGDAGRGDGVDAVAESSTTKAFPGGFGRVEMAMYSFFVWLSR